jgi:hypothetical protein
MDPVGIAATSGNGSSLPSRMMEPLPNCFSIWLTARSTAFSLSSIKLPPVPSSPDNAPRGDVLLSRRGDATRNSTFFYGFSSLSLIFAAICAPLQERNFANPEIKIFLDNLAIGI